PAWFHRLSVGFMFYAELVAPFFVFGPRPLRLAGFASMMLFQALIASTGNYGFFNLLAAVLCLSVLDDRDWEIVRRWTSFAAFLPRGIPSSVPGGGCSERGSGGEGRPDAPPCPDGHLPPGGKARPPCPWSRGRRWGVGLLGGILIAVTAAQTVEEVW